MVKHIKKLILFTAMAAILLTGCARKTPERMINDIQKSLKQRDYPGAISKLENFLEKYPNHQNAIQAQFQIGDIYGVQGQYNRALQEYQKVIDKYPAKNEMVLDAKFAIADCYAVMSTWGKARDIWTAISQDTVNPVAGIAAKNKLAQSYLFTKDWDKAEASYKSVIAALPLPKNSLKGLNEKAMKDANERIQIDATVGLVETYNAAQKYPKAIETLQSIQNKFPDNEYAQSISMQSNIMIGDIYMEQKQDKKAKEYYAKGIATYAKLTAYSSDSTKADKAIWATSRMGELYEMKMQDTTTAISIYQSIIKEHGKTKWAFYAKNGIARINQQIAKAKTKDATGKDQKPEAPVFPISPAKKK